MLPFDINHKEIIATIAWAEENKDNHELSRQIMQKAALMQGLDYKETALILTAVKSEELFTIAREIKQEIYGSRVVLFAPLYLSNHCINGCTYCPYNAINTSMPRKQLTQDEIRREVIALEKMGHKRIVIEAGEHPQFSPIQYIVESMDTIYKSGDIRRINVNIAAATVDDYRKLKQAGIGTYILFQETYHKPTYNAIHPTGPKANYTWHSQAMDRAMEAGLDDVGIGALFGLADYRYEVVAMLMHAQHLETTYGVGPHTISVPRIRKAHGVNTDNFKHGVTDDEYARIVATLRIAAPYAGIIVSTRECETVRRKVLDIGVSQISGGSRTDVGGYEASSNNRHCGPDPQSHSQLICQKEMEPHIKHGATSQFEIQDNRSLGEIVHWLLDIGHIPSFCTACYRAGRVGKRFMELCKSGQIQSTCQPNALITLQEYLQDYADTATRQIGEKLIDTELCKIENQSTRSFVKESTKQIKQGRRDIKI